VTGVVASNLIGRLISGSVADIAGLAANFYVFAGLNLVGAALVAVSLQPSMKMAPSCSAPRPALAAWAAHLNNPPLRAAFAIGFLILFVFIGTFTYVNFELAKPPLDLSPMHLGFVYLVFLPAMVTTPLAGRAVQRWGTRRPMLAALAGSIAALPMIAAPSLGWVLAGLATMGVGTFFAQAVATGYVGRTATSDRAAASGLYLAAYYLGGLVGAAVLGQVYDRLGWPLTVTGIGLALGAALLLGTRLAEPAR
jgi:predicted MFS family arabinose efflux permease